MRNPFISWVMKWRTLGDHVDFGKKSTYQVPHSAMTFTFGRKAGNKARNCNSALDSTCSHTELPMRHMQARNLRRLWLSVLFTKYTLHDNLLNIQFFIQTWNWAISYAKWNVMVHKVQDIYLGLNYPKNEAFAGFGQEGKAIIDLRGQIPAYHRLLAEMRLKHQTFNSIQGSESSHPWQRLRSQGPQAYSLLYGGTWYEMTEAIHSISELVVSGTGLKPFN